MTKPARRVPTASGARCGAKRPDGRPAAAGGPAWTRVMLVAGGVGVLTGSAVMAGPWALGHWGTAWLVAHFTGHGTPAPAALPFAFGPTTAGALALAFGLTAALSLGREMTAHGGRNRRSSAA